MRAPHPRRCRGPLRPAREPPDWLRGDVTTSAVYRESVQLAVVAFNTRYRKQDACATVHDAVADDWPTIASLMSRVSEQRASDAAAERYADLLPSINDNTAQVTHPIPRRAPKPTNDVHAGLLSLIL
mgnify:FL=1